jgi:hypothetical protein
LLDLLEQVSGLVDIPRGVLLQTEFSHCVDKLSIEEALLARLGLADALLQSSDRILIEWFFVRGRGAGWKTHSG